MGIIGTVWSKIFTIKQRKIISKVTISRDKSLDTRIVRLSFRPTDTRGYIRPHSGLHTRKPKLVCRFPLRNPPRSSHHRLRSTFAHPDPDHLSHIVAAAYTSGDSSMCSSTLELPTAPSLSRQDTSPSNPRKRVSYNLRRNSRRFVPVLPRLLQLSEPPYKGPEVHYRCNILLLSLRRLRGIWIRRFFLVGILYPGIPVYYRYRSDMRLLLKKYFSADTIKSKSLVHNPFPHTIYVCKKQ